MAAEALTASQAALRGTWLCQMRRALEHGQTRVALKDRPPQTFASAADLGAKLEALRADARSKQRRAWIRFSRPFGVYERGQHLQLDLCQAADVVFMGVANFTDDKGAPLPAVAQAPRRSRWLPVLAKGWLSQPSTSPLEI